MLASEPCMQSAAVRVACITYVVRRNDCMIASTAGYTESLRSSLRLRCCIRCSGTWALSQSQRTVLCLIGRAARFRWYRPSRALLHSCAVAVQTSVGARHGTTFAEGGAATRVRIESYTMPEHALAVRRYTVVGSRCRRGHHTFRARGDVQFRLLQSRSMCRGPSAVLQIVTAVLHRFVFACAAARAVRLARQRRRTDSVGFLGRCAGSHS